MIQPGSRITVAGTVCTADWVFEGQGRLRGQQFLGTATLCTRYAGQRVYLDTSYGAGPAEPGLYVGAVAYISNFGFALIRIDRTARKYVVAAMAGHPDIPQRAGSGTAVKIGDTCQFADEPLGAYVLPRTVPSPPGVLVAFNSGEQYCDGGPGLEFYDGGPAADSTAGNAALGITTRGLGIGTDPTLSAGQGGVTVTAMIADAGKHGFAIRLRTVG